MLIKNEILIPYSNWKNGMHNYLSSLPFLSLAHSEGNLDISDISDAYVFYNITNSDLYITVSYIRGVGSNREIHIGLADSLEKTSIKSFIHYTQYDPAESFSFNFATIFTEDLVTIKCNNNSSIKLCRFNHDYKLHNIDPFLFSMNDLVFDKVYFSKDITDNKKIMLPVRLKNATNKIVNYYPLSCFYINSLGFINDTIYKFRDGEYGYYKDNILYK